MKPSHLANARSLNQFSGIALFLIALIMLPLISCNPSTSQAQSSETSTLPPRDSVRNTLRNVRAMAIIYPESSEFSQQYLDWAEALQQNSRFMSVSIFGDNSIPDSILTNYPLMIIGQKENHKLLKEWLQYTPIQPTRNGFRFQGSTFEANNYNIFLSWYPHPKNPLIPVTILTGNSDQSLIDVLHSAGQGNGFGFSFGNWDYQVFEGEHKRLIGNYTNDWRPDLNVRWEFNPDEAPVATTQAAHIYLHEVEDPNIASIISDSLLVRKTRFEQWSGKTLPEIPLDLHLYGHPETMGLSEGEMLTGYRKRNSLHRIVHPQFIHQDPGLEWSAWMDQAFGEASEVILSDGIRVWLTPGFQQLGFKNLGASLLRAEGTIPLSVMLDPAAYQRESPLVRDCYAGIFVDFLLGYWGREEFLVRYQNIGNTSSDQALNEEWIRYQNELTTTESVRDQWGSLPEFHKGMTFAHEGYQVYNGYGSRQAEKALQHLSALGTNAIAIVPYTGTSNPQSSQPLRWSRGAGGENDASVILSHYGTTQAGMVTMLKPQVWVRGGWPGDVDMVDEAEWERWFDHYHRWIRHYAVLAEIHKMDILCLGTEFRYATMKHPARWRDLVHRIRHIYHGTITYAANWGEETDNLDFADALDFVGVNFYYPLSSSDTPTDEQLLSKMEQTLSSLDKLSSKWGKPYVLTEIGYRSISAPWEHPHAEAGNAEESERDQARCYQAVFAALPNHPACKGLYWWKWPSYEQYSHRNPRSFTPCGKEAEALLKSAYLAQ